MSNALLFCCKYVTTEEICGLAPPQSPDPPTTSPVARRIAKSRGSSSSGSATPRSQPPSTSSNRRPSMARRGGLHATASWPTAVTAQGVASNSKPASRTASTAIPG